ncbi:MAG: hypothetical protein CMJ40_06190 [Phycisphaerae bacterium]|nr:hypothetical protein [Phycisphaerae bacterium]
MDEANAILNTPRANRMVRYSLVMNVVMVVLSFVFAILTGSNAILLDGFFSLIGVAQVVAMGSIMRMQGRPDDSRHPFGFSSFVPLLNSIRGLTILAVCGFAGFQAVLSIINGGDHPDAGLGMIYGAAAALGCLFTGFVMARAARELGNPLLKVDSHSWLIDGFYSLVVSVAFGIAMIMQSLEWTTAARYVDPVLVLVLLLLAIPWPWGVMRDGVRELLLIGPPEGIRRQVIEQVNDVMSSLKPRDVICRILLSHDQLYVMCHVLVDGDAVISVTEIDRVRQAAMDCLGEHHTVSEFDLIITSNDEYGRLAD